MIYAFAIVVLIEVFWAIWGNSVNAMHATLTLADWAYFLCMFPFAAAIDFVAIQFLLHRRYTREEFTFIQVLIALFATSIAVHLVGAYGFYVDSPIALRIYDTIGIFIFIGEVAVFVYYGSRTLHNRYRNHSTHRS